MTNESPTVAPDTNPAYQYDLPAIGDIVFCRGPGKSSTWNVFGQRVLRCRGPVLYSHVALQMGGFVLHAMPGQGVHASSTLALLQEQREWRVYRHKSRDIPDTQANVTSGQALLLRHARYALGQRYNTKFLIPKFRFLLDRVDPTAFCSELICNLYGGTIFPDRMKRPTSVLPDDIYRALHQSENWIDVTKIYEQHLANCSRGGLLDRWIENQQSHARLFESLTRFSTRRAVAELDIAMFQQGYEIVDAHIRALVGAAPGPKLAMDEAKVRQLESVSWVAAKTGALNRRLIKTVLRESSRTKSRQRRS